MKNIKLIVLICLMLQLLTACSLVLPSPTPKETIYVLGENLEFQKNGKFTKRPLRIWISDIEGSSLIDSRKILFSREPSVRGEYQLATWAETPPTRFAELLGKALTTFDIFKAVSVGDNLANAEIALSGKISEFYHDATVTPPLVRVSLTVTLLKLQTRSKIAEKTFEKNIPLQARNPIACFDWAPYSTDKVESIRYLVGDVKENGPVISRQIGKYFSEASNLLPSLGMNLTVSSHSNFR